MVEYKIIYSKLALKDAKKLSCANLANKVKELLDIIKMNPFQNPPPYEKLVGNLSGAYSRRINIQHRLVYQVKEDEKLRCNEKNERLSYNFSLC